MTEQVRCAVYARFSGNNQRDASIDDQVRKCVNSAASKGWVILPEHIYADRAISGKSMSPRLEFKKLMSLAMSGSCPFNKILVDETSRVARNTRDALDVFSLLTFYDVHVFYVSQGIDTSHESAEQMITVNGMIDSLYLKNLAKETHRGIEGQVLKGYSGGGRRYGYRSVPVHNGKVDIYGQPEADGFNTIIDTEESEMVIRIFRDYAEKGLSVKRIVKNLNKEVRETGLPIPPRGKWWSASTIAGSKKYRRGILNNEFYIGKYYWNCAKSKINPSTGKRIMRMNDKDLWKLIDKPHLAIVPEALWNKAKARQNEVSKATSKGFMKAKSLYSTNLLTGLLKCPQCRGNLVVLYGGTYGKYCCSNNWNKGESVCTNSERLSKIPLEKEVILSAVPDFSADRFFEYLHKKIVALLSEKFKETEPAWQNEALTRDFAKTEKEIANMLNAIRVGIITASVKENLLALENNKSILSAKLKASGKNANNMAPAISTAMLQAYLDDMYGTLHLNSGMGRMILSKLLVFQDDDKNKEKFYEKKEVQQRAC